MATNETKRLYFPSTDPHEWGDHGAGPGSEDWNQFVGVYDIGVHVCYITGQITWTLALVPTDGGELPLLLAAGDSDTVAEAGESAMEALKRAVWRQS